MNSEDEESKEPGSEEVKGINPRKRKYDEVSGKFHH